MSNREVYTLLNGIEGKKNTTTNDFRLVRKCFTSLNLKLIREKIKSHNPKDALVLNILNDLSKIPIYLKPFLKKETLLKKLTCEKQEKEDENKKIYVEKAQAVTKHGEIFSYRCLQYLELFEIAPKIAFQINLGKVYLKKPYEKTVFGKTYTRELDKEIHTFGKLRYFDHYFDGYVETKKYGEQKITTFREPLKFYRPKYHFTNKRIGFNIVDEDYIPSKIELIPISVLNNF